MTNELSTINYIIPAYKNQYCSLIRSINSYIIIESPTAGPSATPKSIAMKVIIPNISAVIRKL
ncbi:MAG: hypothetical protein H6Q68_840 [Firmicutes bacterium]|nr:hypothetical protein [Bacillota bacterium]